MSKIAPILFKIIIIILNIQLCNQQTSLKSIADDLGMFYSITKSTIEEIFQKNDALKTSTFLQQYYNSSNTPYEKEDIKTKRITEAFEYLLFYSSRTNNDLSTYYECVKTNSSNINNYTYLIIQFDQKLEAFYPNTMTLGLCLVYDASSEYTNNIKDIINKNNADADYVIIPKGTDFSVLNVVEFQNSSNEWYEILILCIGLMVITVLTLFSLFNIIPEYLFKCCFKKQHYGESSITEKKDDLNKSKLYHFVSCFSIAENSDELFGNTLNTIIYNDTGLSYSKGVNSICMILFLFGLTYMRLFQSSTVMYQEKKYENTLRNALLPLLSFGLRFCPRIIFSISGFTFIYKILCFFEEEITKNQEEKDEVKHELDQTVDNNNNDNYNNEYNNDNDNKDIKNPKLNQTLDTLIKKGILLDRNEHNLSNIRFISLFIFIIKQSHKFMNALFIILIFKTINIIMKPLTIICSSLAILYKDILGNIYFEDIFGHFFLYKTFYLFDGYLTREKHDYCCMRLIWIFINEVFFFILSSPIIFLCCKYKISLNKVILSLLSFFLIFRYLIYYLMIQAGFNYSNSYQRATNTLYDYSSYNSFAMNPLYNYPDFLIGIFFGLMNYVLQKDINISSQHASIFSLSSAIVYYLKYQSKLLLYFFVIIIAAIVCTIAALQQLFYLAISNNDKDFYSNEGINGFYLIDIEIVIVLIHLLLFALYAKGGTSLTQILSEQSWIKFNKLYFSVITSINMCLLLIIHQSETMISLEIFSFFFYGSIIFAAMLLFGYINCIFNEFPLKKILKLIISECRGN